jgi:hypothetical protein
VAFARGRRRHRGQRGGLQRVRVREESVRVPIQLSFLRRENWALKTKVIL